MRCEVDGGQGLGGPPSGGGGPDTAGRAHRGAGSGRLGHRRAEGPANGDRERQPERKNAEKDGFGGKPHVQNTGLRPRKVTARARPTPAGPVADSSRAVTEASFRKGCGRCAEIPSGPVAPRAAWRSASTAGGPPRVSC